MSAHSTHQRSLISEQFTGSSEQELGGVMLLWCALLLFALVPKALCDDVDGVRWGSGGHIIGQNDTTRPHHDLGLRTLEGGLGQEFGTAGESSFSQTHADSWEKCPDTSDAVWFDTPTFGEIFRGDTNDAVSVPVKCSWQQRCMPDGGSAVLYYDSGEDLEYLSEVTPAFDGPHTCIGPVSITIGAHGPNNGRWNLTCVLVDDQGVRANMASVKLQVLKNAGHHPGYVGKANDAAVDDNGAQPRVDSRIYPPETPSSDLFNIPKDGFAAMHALRVSVDNINERVDCHRSTCQRFAEIERHYDYGSTWCRLRGAVARHGAFRVPVAHDDAAAMTAVAEALPRVPWRAMYRNVCCQDAVPYIDVAPQPVEHIKHKGTHTSSQTPTAERSSHCDRVVNKQAYVFHLSNFDHFGHTWHDSTLALYATIAENNNGEFTDDIIVIVNLVAPVNRTLDRFMSVFGALSRHAMVSLTQLNSMGSVCFDDLTIGANPAHNYYEGPLPITQRATKIAAGSAALWRKALQVTFSPLRRAKLTILNRQRSTDGSLPMRWIPTNIEDTIIARSRALGIDAAALLMEGKTLQQQCAALQDTTILISVHGCGLHNAWCLPQGSTVIGIAPYGSRPEMGFEFEVWCKLWPGRYVEVTPPMAPEWAAARLSENSTRPLDTPNEIWRNNWLEGLYVFYHQTPILVPVDEIMIHVTTALEAGVNIGLPRSLVT